MKNQTKARRWRLAWSWLRGRVRLSIAGAR